MNLNIVNSGSVYQVYDEGMQTAKSLPPLIYDVKFSKMQGFFLMARVDIKVEEEKIYGNYIQKINKVLNGYKAVDRNFGVILSGPKGVGKTLFTKLLSNAAREQDYPIIIVSDYIPGVANFLSSIDQDVIVLFDEFEKVFAETEKSSPQDEMLSLFDGLDSGHKLFIVTCNKIQKLSDYLLNRPGRFHYHFVLDVPNAEEIREYLEDKLAPPYRDAIDSIINFSNFGKITYDCLRAIAFELNQGYSLEETINDLNLTRDTSISFDIVVEFMDGAQYRVRSQNIDLLKNETWGRWFNSIDGSDHLSIWVSFNPRSVKPDPNNTKEMCVPVNEIVECHYDQSDLYGENDPRKAVIDARLDSGIKSVRLVRQTIDRYKYLI